MAGSGSYAARFRAPRSPPARRSARVAGEPALTVSPVDATRVRRAPRLQRASSTVILPEQPPVAAEPPARDPVFDSVPEDDIFQLALEAADADLRLRGFSGVDDARAQEHVQFSANPAFTQRRSLFIVTVNPKVKHISQVDKVVWETALRLAIERGDASDLFMNHPTRDGSSHVDRTGAPVEPLAEHDVSNYVGHGVLSTCVEIGPRYHEVHFHGAVWLEYTGRDVNYMNFDLDFLRPTLQGITGSVLQLSAEQENAIHVNVRYAPPSAEDNIVAYLTKVVSNS
mmetsp:Transcript_14669/g.16377  ORF Transcript_14669/g.16377 Transcript_14669/m.16377 type:complete len:284 (-) Transcript_14669:48-899(-)